MIDLHQLTVKIFADGAEIASIAHLAQNPQIKGFTTNPTLMRKANVTDYQAFALEVLKIVPDRPISFEVFSDEFNEMERQALTIASWGANVYVKIPVTNTRREFAGPLIHRLASQGVQVNVTALMTPEQVRQVAAQLSPNVASFISVFAGRIADTGRDPIPLMEESLAIVRDRPRAELIWASPRELLNIMQADAMGCHAITVTYDILAKLGTIGKDLDAFSLDTVKMFYTDAQRAGYTI